MKVETIAALIPHEDLLDIFTELDSDPRGFDKLIDSLAARCAKEFPKEFSIVAPYQAIQPIELVESEVKDFDSERH